MDYSIITGLVLWKHQLFNPPAALTEDFPRFYSDLFNAFWAASVTSAPHCFRHVIMSRLFATNDSSTPLLVSSFLFRAEVDSRSIKRADCRCKHLFTHICTDFHQHFYLGGKDADNSYLTSFNGSLCVQTLQLREQMSSVDPERLLVRVWSPSGSWKQQFGVFACDWRRPGVWPAVNALMAECCCCRGASEWRAVI